MVKTRSKSVKNNIKKIFNIYLFRNLIVNVIFVVIGLIFLIKPYSSLRVCECVFGSILVLYGVLALFDYMAKRYISIFNFNWLAGALSVIVGVLALLNPFKAIDIIVKLFGVWVIIASLLKVSQAFELKKYKDDSWLVTCVTGGLLFLLGILLLVNPFVELYITRLVGAFLIMYSVLDFSNNILFATRVKFIAKNFEK